MAMTSYIVTLTLISLATGTLAIDCYTCSGGACNDPFFPVGSGVPSTCLALLGISLNSHCVKVVHENGFVTRSCAPLCVQGCALGTCTYCCNSDRCNGGTIIATSFVAMSMPLMTAFYFSRQ